MKGSCSSQIPRKYMLAMDGMLIVNLYVCLNFISYRNTKILHLQVSRWDGNGIHLVTFRGAWHKFISFHHVFSTPFSCCSLLTVNTSLWLKKKKRKKKELYMQALTNSASSIQAWNYVEQEHHMSVNGAKFNYLKIVS